MIIVTTSGEIIFREVQYFRQFWLWCILLPITAVAWYGFISRKLFNIPFGTHPAPDFMLCLQWGLVGIGLPVLFYCLKLVTIVKEDGIYIRFVPFHFSVVRFGFSDLQKYEARTYSPIREYGGWGIKYGRSGKAYNVSGNQGIQLELANGKRVLIGTQRPEDFIEAINEMVNRQPNK